jgi:hypothetical protein
LAKDFDPDKIAIVGRKVSTRVKPLALREGWSFFEVPQAATDEYRIMQRIFGPKPPPDIVARGLGMAKNMERIETWKQNGFSFVDIDEPVGPALEPSTNYDMEKAKLYGTKK